MARNNIAVFGIYSTRAAVENAVIALQRAGLRSADVSVLLPGAMGSSELVTEKATKAPEGAVAGAVIGATLGWLAGLGARALPLPSLGPLKAAGPLAAALAGASVGGTLGGLTGALVGLGIPEYEAKRYEGHVRKGGSLLSVHCDGSHWVTQARGIMEETGAEEISVVSEVPGGHAVDTQPPSGGSEIEETRTLTGPEQVPNSAAENEKDYEEFRIGHSLATSEIASQELPSIEEIKQRAYEIYLRRGASHGHELSDWSLAERELKGGR